METSVKTKKKLVKNSILFEKAAVLISLLFFNLFYAGNQFLPVFFIILCYTP